MPKHPVTVGSKTYEVTTQHVHKTVWIASGNYEGQIIEKKARAEKGDAEAQFNLAGLYFVGQGVDQDYAQAQKWLTKAAEQDLAPAEYNLGVMYEEGQVAAKDYKEAMKWYTKAAEQGDADAQNNLADMYEEGHGVPQDIVRAHMWYSLAAASATGDVKNDATESISRIAAKMTPQQIAQAKEMSQRCQQSKFKNCS